MNILFIDKLSLSEQFSTTIEPIKYFRNCNFKKIFVDDVSENEITKIIYQSNIDTLFLSPSNISYNFYVKLRQLKIDIFLICHELHSHFNEYKKYFDLADGIFFQELAEKYWTHKNKTYFYPPMIFNKFSDYNKNPNHKNKIIDFYYSGTFSLERKFFLEFVKKKFKGNKIIGDGVYSYKKNLDEHRNLLKKSKMTVVFPHPKTYNKFIFFNNFWNSATGWRGLPQMSKTLTFSLPCNEMDFFFKDKKCYIPFFSRNDLLDKINYYNYNNQERTEICDEIYKKYLEVFSDENFYKICEKLKNGQKTSFCFPRTKYFQLLKLVFLNRNLFFSGIIKITNIKQFFYPRFKNTTTFKIYKKIKYVFKN